MEITVEIEETIVIRRAAPTPPLRCPKCSAEMTIDMPDILEPGSKMKPEIELCKVGEKYVSEKT